MTRRLWDWPSAIKPAAAIVIAPSNTVDGAISRNGYENDIPAAGSRNRMRIEFAMLAPENGHWFAWLCNQARGGLFRVPVFYSPQLATDATIAANEAAYAAGIPFSTGEYFSTGYGFAYAPFVKLAANALEGSIQAVLDVSAHPTALTYGKVFGLGRSVHHVDDIEFDGTEALVTLRTPLRRDYTVAADECVTLRPRMIGKIDNPSSLVSPFRDMGHTTPGEITMTEVIDERFL